MDRVPFAQMEFRLLFAVLTYPKDSMGLAGFKLIQNSWRCLDVVARGRYTNR